MTAWALIVHGGAKRIDPSSIDAHRSGCELAARVGANILRAGGSSVEAAAAAIRSLEDDPLFNAGTGSVARSNGSVQCDAALMRGTDLAIGAVGALEGFRNPIMVAAALLDESETLLTGHGAASFASSIAAPASVSSATPAREGDTVGCVALDQSGGITAGTSTGGLSGARPGRVGDSPLPGCGFYADDLVGGVSLSGHGEQIARVTLAAHALALMQQYDPDGACSAALPRLERVGGDAGIIAISADGRMGWAHSSPDFAVAHIDDSEELFSSTRKEYP